MASLSDILSTLQNGVVAINNFGIQLKTTLNRISTRFGNYLPLSAGSSKPLTGDLYITKATPLIELNKSASGQQEGIFGTLSGNARWFVAVGDDTAEGGANSGSNFTIYRYDDAGVFVGTALTITRSSADASFSGDITIAKASAALNLNKAASGQNAAVVGFTNSVIRWFVSFGNSTAEGGANSGSDFSIYRYTDAGAFIGEAFRITRANGNAAFATNIVSISYTGATGANLLLAGDGGVTPNKYIRAQAGNLEFINTGYTAIIATLTDAGELSWTGSAWTAYTPVVTAVAGAFTTASATGSYKQNGKTVHFTVNVVVTNAGTAAVAGVVTLPVAAAVAARGAFSGRENSLTGVGLTSVMGSTTTLVFQRYDGTFIGAAGMTFDISGTYEAA